MYRVDAKPVLVLLRGDHTLVEQKLLDQIEATEIRAARADEVREALGASPGSLGAVGVEHVVVIADHALKGRSNMTTGANEDDFHLRGVDLERDVSVKAWLDLREVEAGEGCPLCDGTLDVDKTIEVGHIFKLGTRYSESLDARVLDENGKARPIVMGSYGIGIGRAMAAVVESNCDADGIVWPLDVAPFEVVVTVLNPKDVHTREAGEGIYEALCEAGIDAILDDRDERPGVKFKDAELVGIPYRVTVGPKGIADGRVELVRRRDRQTSDLPAAKAAKSVIDTVLTERRR